MKHTNPLETAVRLLIISVFAISGILAFINHADKQYSPMDSHVEYILEKHNEHCQYEMGECPQPECSHYHTNL